MFEAPFYRSITSIDGNEAVSNWLRKLFFLMFDRFKKNVHFGIVTLPPIFKNSNSKS